VVAFREFSAEICMKRVSHAIEEAWQVCLRSNGAPRVIANYLFKLREDPTWTEDEIRAVMAGIKARLSEYGKHTEPEAQ
jgi:hypothetical protein